MSIEAVRGRFDAVVLAAGKGTRMRSELPKVLHEAAGLPLLEHVLRALAPLAPATTVVVVGHGSAAVRERFAHAPVTFVEQTDLLGTGHALLQTRPVLARSARPVLVLNGDGPLISTATIAALAAAQGDRDGMTLLTCRVAEPKGLGRIVRSPAGDVLAIVEEKDATVEQLAGDEINPGIYAFDSGVFDLAERITNANKAGEYYITDLLALYRAAGRLVRGLPADSEVEVLAVNDRIELARADRALRDRCRQRWLVAGVSMPAPEQVFVDLDVELGSDVVLHPGVHLRGRTEIGAGAVVEPGAVLRDCVVEPGATVPANTVATGLRFAAT